MLSSLIGSFCGANSNNIFASTAAAVCAMGICGEKAYAKTVATDAGTSTFRNYLIDYMSKLDSTMLEEGAKIDYR